MKTSVLLLSVLCFKSLCFAQEPAGASNLTVVGTVFCDTCSSKIFSKHNYFLEGVEVHVECRSREKTSKAGRVLFSANATTNKYGVYAILLPSSEGISCIEKQAKRLICRASLVRSSSSSPCNHPGQRSSTKHMMLKSKQAHICVYSLRALSYRPPKRDFAVCGAYKEKIPPKALNSSEFFWPFIPPFGFPFPSLPPLPHWPSLPLPPLPPLPPFPHFPPFPFPFPPSPFTMPPSLPFPFPTLPPLFPPLTPVFSPPPPPPPPPPTWFPPLPPLFPPLAPLFSPAPPPPFWTPWFPFFPPSPTAPQNQNP